MVIIKEIGTTAIKQYKTKFGAKLFINKMKKYGQYWEIHIEHKIPINKEWPLQRGGTRA